LIRGVPGPLSRPTKNLQSTAQEREMVATKFGAAIFGGAERVAARLQEFLEETRADELMVVTNTYDFADRLRSYELLANLADQRQEEPEIVARGEALDADKSAVRD
jgi:alkanesulfonate monooxygenase SsuD/methylene tetrahydromethanopterin reductase-like flavin-dependent oxidoreductase (luciferase family)